MKEIEIINECESFDCEISIQYDKEMNVLAKLTSIVNDVEPYITSFNNESKCININTNLGRYTFVTVSLLLDTNFTLTVTILLKKFHIESPIKTNIGKYCTFELNTTIAIKVYININANGSKIIHKNPKCELITSVFNSAQVAYNI